LLVRPEHIRDLLLQCSVRFFSGFAQAGIRVSSSAFSPVRCCCPGRRSLGRACFPAERLQD
jgi:hypothetical protein